MPGIIKLLKTATNNPQLHMISTRIYKMNTQISKFLFLLFSFIPFLCHAQVEIDLPVSINIYNNEVYLPVSDNWIDSLITEASSGKLHYTIAGAYADNEKVITRLHVPQILSLHQVYYQVIFYYALLSTETDRVKEQVLIYPYFFDINKQPFIMCNYKTSGKYYFTVKHWSVVPVPPMPDPEEKWIFNQIIEAMLDGIQKMGSTPEELFRQIAEKNNLPVNRVQSIYENTILWQESQ